MAGKSSGPGGRRRPGASLRTARGQADPAGPSSLPGVSHGRLHSGSSAAGIPRTQTCRAVPLWGLPPSRSFPFSRILRKRKSGNGGWPWGFVFPRVGCSSRAAPGFPQIPGPVGCKRSWRPDPLGEKLGFKPSPVLGTNRPVGWGRDRSRPARGQRSVGPQGFAFC